MIVWLVRHTKTTVPDGICYGCTDVGLPDHFADEAAALVGRMRAAGPVEVYTSPLRRCHALARLIGSPRVDARLKELDFGRWEMQRWDSIDRGELEQWRSGLADWVVPQGESLGELAVRVGAFLDDLRASKCEAACVVTHGGVIRVSSCLLWDQPLEKALDVHIPFGGALKIEIADNGPRLLERHGGAEGGTPGWMR